MIWETVGGSSPVGVAYAAGFTLFMLCFVTQSLEFHSAGISPESILNLVGFLRQSENLRFVEYHVVKSAGIVFIHSFIPLIFFLLNPLVSSGPFFDIPAGLLAVGFGLSVLLPVVAAGAVLVWKRDDWADHPFVRKVLSQSTGVRNWRAMAADVDTEFRRVDKLVIRSGNVGKVVITDNWILKVGQWPWSFAIAHQSDVRIEVIRSDNFNLSVDTPGAGAQFLTVR